MITAFLPLIPVPLPQSWNMTRYGETRRKPNGVKTREQNPSLKERK